MFKFQSELATFIRCPDTDNQNSVLLESGLSEHFLLRANWKLQSASAVADYADGDRAQVLRRRTERRV